MKKIIFFTASLVAIPCITFSCYGSENNRPVRLPYEGKVTKSSENSPMGPVITYLKTIGAVKIIARCNNECYHLQICNLPGHLPQNPPRTELDELLLTPELLDQLKPYLRATCAFKKLAEEHAAQELP